MCAMYGPTAVAATIQGTSYTAMNEWLQLPSQAFPSRPQRFLHPLSPAYRELEAEKAGNERQLASRQIKDWQSSRDEEHPTLSSLVATEEGFKKTYDRLMKNMAYRWPNPGLPRFREGCIGGTWRHIREVAGQEGSRYLYVDGLVSIYDREKFNERLLANFGDKPHLRALCASLKQDVTADAVSQIPGRRVVPASSLCRDLNLERKLQLQERYPINRRGFYSYP